MLRIARPVLVTLLAGTCAALAAGCAAPSDAAPAPAAPATTRASAAAAAVAAAPPATPTPVAPVRLTIAASGDFLIHTLVYQRALANGHGLRYNFRPMFRWVKPIIQGADLGICHFETPMAGGAPVGYPSFNTPKSLAKDAKATGWDLCDTASNHTLDMGQPGIDSTLRAVRSAGIISTGSARSRHDARQVAMVDVQGIKVALLAYTDISNGQIQPHPWSLNTADATRIKADAARARAAGARIVLVNLHWGDEFQHYISSRQAQLARQLTASPDIDAVIGQHVHVVQPIQFHHRKPVVFGEGNLVSNQSSACCATGTEDGIIPLLRFTVTPAKVRVTHVDYVPVTVRRPDYGVIPIGTGLRRRLMDRGSLLASYNRTLAVIGRSRRVTPIPLNAH